MATSSMQVYSDFPAEKFRNDQVKLVPVIDWHKNHTLDEVALYCKGHLGKGQQSAPLGFHFVLSTPLGYFPHHLVPHKPTPAFALRLARRFDNILLAESHGQFWANYLPENIKKTIIVRLVPVTM